MNPIKSIACGMIALAVAALAFAAPTEAQSGAKKYRYSAKQQARKRVDGTANRNVPDYSEFIADSRPFGSTSWWEQMDREGRGGQSRAN